MSVTLTIDEALLREAEQATDIHDWPTLVMKGLKEIARKPPPREDAQPLAAGHLPPASGNEPLPSKVWTAETFDRTLAAAAQLPDLTDAEFDAFLAEMNRPLPAPWTE